MAEHWAASGPRRRDPEVDDAVAPRRRPRVGCPDRIDVAAIAAGSRAASASPCTWWSPATPRGGRRTTARLLGARPFVVRGPLTSPSPTCSAA